MYLVAIAWLYVTLLMALTESSITRGVATFVLYGAFPLSIVLYLLNTPARRRARRARESDGGSAPDPSVGQPAAHALHVAAPTLPAAAGHPFAAHGPSAVASDQPPAAHGPSAVGADRLPAAPGPLAAAPDQPPAAPGPPAAAPTETAASRAPAAPPAGSIQTQAAIRPVTPSRRNE